MHDDHLSRLFDAYDDGAVSRRHLIACIAGFATAAATGPAALATIWQHAEGETKSDEPKKDKPKVISSSFKAIDVNHVALSVTDVARSRDWYVRHLGLKVASESRSNCFLRCSTQNFLALFAAKKGGLNHYCFAVENYDADEAVKKLKAAGLEARRRSDRVYFDDPDGIEVQVAGTDHRV